VNRKLEFLTTMTCHAVGREHAKDSVDVASVMECEVKDASAYLFWLWQEGSLDRFAVCERITKTGKRRTTYRYYIKKSANVKAVLAKSEIISNRGRFRPKPPGFDASALVACW
jgi:hypothetical protein